MKIKVLLSLIIALILSLPALAQTGETAIVEELDLPSEGRAYASLIAYPALPGEYPAIVLMHSFNGMQAGYRDMTAAIAAEGYVVLALGWQAFERSPADAVVEQLLRDSVDFLRARADVDAARIGLTGFCAGGRYTMLFLPQIEGFAAGVAWYGFPNFGDPKTASDVIDQLDAPMLIIHGGLDRPSPIADIYAYATALGKAGKDFELKVYSNEPHGFMLLRGEWNDDDVATDAYQEMLDYFRRKLI